MNSFIISWVYFFFFSVQDDLFFLTWAESSSELFWLPVIHLSIHKLFTFSSSSPEPLGQFQPNLAQSIIRWRESRVSQIYGHTLFQREIITKLQKYLSQVYKNCFFRTIRPISTKLGTKHPWVKRIQVSTNKDLSIMKKEMMGFSKSTLWYNHSSLQMCLLFLLDLLFYRRHLFMGQIHQHLRNTQHREYLSLLFLQHLCNA